MHNEKYHFSKYNVELEDYPYSGGVTLYNLATKSMVFFENGNEYRELNGIDEETISYMLEEKIIFHSLEEEQDFINEHMQKKFDTEERLEVTVVLTRDCNLRCIYCFEGDSCEEYLSEEKCSALINEIDQDMKENNRKYLHIRFYGGEPTLNLGAIRRLNEHFHAEYGDNYSFHVVTNGVLLSKNIVEEWRKYGLDRIKVTLDGDKEFHDSRRIAKDGSSTFAKIVDNLGLFPIELENVLHVVIDDSNIDHIEGMLVELSNRKYQDRFGISLTYTHPFVNVSAEKRAEDIVRVARLVKKYGFVQDNLLGLDGEGICPFKNHNAYVYDIDGERYKCTGCLAVKDNPNAKFYSHTERYESEEMCLECKYLPICNGGCRFLRMYNNDRTFCQKIYFDKLAPQILKEYIDYSLSDE